MKGVERKNILNSFLGGVLGGMLVVGLAVVALMPVLQDPLDQGPEHVEISVASDVADIVEEVNPAVVSIVVTQEVPVFEEYYEDPFGEGNPFGLRVPRLRENGTEEQRVSGGTGFFISNDGYIATNAHVVAVEDASYTVFTNTGDAYDAEVIARDQVLDTAVLKVQGEEFPHLTFGDSDSIRPGEPVIAIGNALAEFNNSVSVGVVSGLSRSIVAGGVMGSELLENVIQTDAAINPGNSGGPLIDLSGNVIGVNTAVSRGAENIGFAVPSNAVKRVVDSILEHGRVVRPQLGVRYVSLTPAVADRRGVGVDKGALIVGGETDEQPAVLPNSAADEAGLKAGDVIVSVDGEAVDSDTTLGSVIRSKTVGQEIQVKILRDGEEQTLTIILKEVE